LCIERGYHYLRRLGQDSVHDLLGVGDLLGLLDSHARNHLLNDSALLASGLDEQVLLGQPPANRPSLLRTQVLGEAIVRLAGELGTDGFSGLLAEDSQDTGNVLADALDLVELGGGTVGNLGGAEASELLLQLGELVQESLTVLSSEFASLDLYNTKAFA